MREIVFSRLVEQLLDGAHPLSRNERQRICDSLARLLAAIPAATKTALVRRLLDEEHPPRQLVRLLALDEIEVAAPLLGNSAMLDHNDLCEVTRQRGVEHKLRIAGRDDLSTLVTDCLVEDGNEQVIEKLVDNPRAAFSLGTLARLAADYRHIGSVAAFLGASLGSIEEGGTAAEPPLTAPQPAPEPPAPGTADSETSSAPPSWLSRPQPATPRPAAPKPPQPPETPRLAKERPPVWQTDRPADDMATHADAASGGAAPESRLPEKEAAEDTDLINLSSLLPGPGNSGNRLERLNKAAEATQDQVRAAADWTWEMDRFGAFTDLSEGSGKAFHQPPVACIQRSFLDYGEFANDDGSRRAIHRTLARHTAFRNARFVPRPARPDRAAEMWVINGVPTFDLASGAFTGYRGTAARSPATTEGETIAGVRPSPAAPPEARPANKTRQPNVTTDVTTDLATIDARLDRVAGLGHELRTPLNAIIGFAELIAAGAAAGESNRCSEPAMKIRDAAWHMNSFVTDLLDNAKLEAGKMVIEQDRIALHSAVNRAVTLYNRSNGANHLEIAVQPVSTDLAARGDEEVLARLLVKIMEFIGDNVSGAPKPVLKASNGDDLQIIMRCDNCTLKEADMDTYIRAARLDNRESSEYHLFGAGLKLVLVQRLARLMDGDVTFSVSGDALCFTISLKAA